jgi:hypothetical protein
MAYGGHALDMIMRLKANRDMKKARREKLQKAKDSHSHATHMHYPGPKKSEIDPEITEKVKQEFQNKLKNESRKRWINTIILLSITVALIILIGILAY